jgi:hypothetical protein
MTGYTAADILGRPVPEALEPLTLCRDYDVPAIARRVITAYATFQAPP